MSRITVTVVDEEGKPVEFARVAFSARVILPRYLDDEGAAARVVSAVEARVVQLAARTDAHGIAVISDRPAPRFIGPLGPLYILARAANRLASTPFVDWVLMGGKLFITVDHVGFEPRNYLARPGESVTVPLRRLRGDVLRGRVIDSKGRLTWGATLSVHSDEGGPVIAVGYTDPHGEFAIAVSRPWRFMVRVTPPEDLRAEGEQAVTIPMDTKTEADARTIAGPVGPSVAVKDTGR